jgi:hypothetical protein
MAAYNAFGARNVSHRTRITRYHQEYEKGARTCLTPYRQNLPKYR